MAYRLADGTKVPALDAALVQLALATFEFYGGSTAPSPEDAMAHALAAVRAELEDRVRRDRESRSWHEANARELAVSLDLARARERAEVRSAVKGYGRHALASRLS